jgi:D-apiose dehydrogenase
VKVWNVGLIGTGYWSDKHLKAWSRIPNVKVAALCNRGEDKLLARAREFGVSNENLYRSLDEMLDRDDVDIIDIVTGPETHLDFVRKSANKGKHIMCQKPFARSVAEAQEMADIAKSAGIRLMVTENWRWLEPFQSVKRILESGEFGKLYVARYTHCDYYTPRMAAGVSIPQPFFRTMPHLIFYEMGAHWFDTWRSLFGTPSRLYAELSTVSPHVKGEDSGIVVLGHDGFHGVLDMSWATRRTIKDKLPETVGPNHLEQLIVESHNATLKLYFDGHITVTDGTGPEVTVQETSAYDHEESHYRLQSHFISCLDTGAEFQTSAQHNVTTLKMVFGTYESAAEHRVVTI